MPNTSTSTSVSDSAALVARSRDTRRSAAPMADWWATVCPAGAAAASASPNRLTIATLPNATPWPAQLASAPTAGPATEPAESMPITIPDSRPRRPGGALSVTQAIEAVQIEPDATPWTNRASTSTSALGAQAKISVDTAISDAENTVIRFAPIRGTRAMQPIDTIGTETGYAATTAPACRLLSPKRST